MARRMFQISLMLYVSYSRLDDLIKLKVGHSHLAKKFARLGIPRTKTDQIRGGDRKYMAPAQNPALCPVQHLREWLKHHQVVQHKAGALFPSNRRLFVSISKTTYRENLNMAMKGSGLSKITPRGFRAGFTLAVLEQNVRPSRLQLAGGWA